MFLSTISGAFHFVFSALYRGLTDQVTNNFTSFARGFETFIFAAAAIVFLLMVAGIVLRRAKRLPAAYEVKVIDLDGNQVRVDGLRNIFLTYDAAESYARSYSANYAGQYRFKVFGLSKQ